MLIILSGLTADQIIKSGKLSRTNVRKIFNGTSNYVPMLAVIGLGFIDCSRPYIGLILICIGLSFT